MKVKEIFKILSIYKKIKNERIPLDPQEEGKRATKGKPNHKKSTLNRYHTFSLIKIEILKILHNNSILYNKILTLCAGEIY